MTPQDVQRVAQWCQHKLSLLHFDEPTHTYTVNGVRYRSVSQLIAPFNQEFVDKLNPQHPSFVPQLAEIMPMAVRRGKDVHRYLEAHEQGQPLPQVVKAAQPCLKRWNFLMRLYGQNMSLVGAEVSVFAPMWKLAGTVDRLYYDTKTQELILLDLKSGSFRDVNRYQLAAYDLLLQYHGVVVDKAVVLSLKPTETNGWNTVSRAVLNKLHEKLVPFLRGCVKPVSR